MLKVLKLSSGLCALATLAFVWTAATQSDFCADNCDRWRHLNTDAEVTYEQLKHMLSTGSIQLFDVREPDEVKEGVISGAVNIPLGDVHQALRLNPQQFKQRYGVSKPKAEDADFVLYCQRGRRSLTALETAWALGYTRARHYAGGFNEWIQRESL